MSSSSCCAWTSLGGAETVTQDATYDRWEQRCHRHPRLLMIHTGTQCVASGVRLMSEACVQDHRCLIPQHASLILSVAIATIKGVRVEESRCPELSDANRSLVHDTSSETRWEGQLEEMRRLRG